MTSLVRILWVCKSCKVKTKTAIYFLRILEKEMRDYISVGVSPFHKLLSDIYVTALLLLFNSLFGWIPRHTGINPCRDTSEFCKCALCVINCCQTRAAQAAFWQQANMLSAGCRLSWPLNIFCLWSLHDPSLTESRTSLQRQYKKPLKKSGSKHKFTGRLAKRAHWLKHTIS